MIRIEFYCPSCKNSFTNEDAERICSNCFACTGCIRYSCPKCGAEIVKQPVKKMKFRKKKTDED